MSRQCACNPQFKNPPLFFFFFKYTSYKKAHEWTKRREERGTCCAPALLRHSTAAAGHSSLMSPHQGATLYISLSFSLSEKPDCWISSSSTPRNNTCVGKRRSASVSLRAKRPWRTSWAARWVSAEHRTSDACVEGTGSVCDGGVGVLVGLSVETRCKLDLERKKKKNLWRELAPWPRLKMPPELIKPRRHF